MLEGWRAVWALGWGRAVAWLLSVTLLRRVGCWGWGAIPMLWRQIARIWQTVCALWREPLGRGLVVSGLVGRIALLWLL